MTLAKKNLQSCEKKSEKSVDLNSSLTPDSGVASNSSRASDLDKVDDENFNANDLIESSSLKIKERRLDGNSLNKENNLEKNFTLNDKKIDEFIKSKINNAMLVENIGTEMTYSISNKTEHTKNYENFFHQIEENMDNLGCYLLLCFLLNQQLTSGC